MVSREKQVGNCYESVNYLAERTLFFLLNPSATDKTAEGQGPRVRSKEHFMSCFTIRPVGDSALSVEFENIVSREINARVTALAARLETLGISGLGELVPSYRALLVHYDPLRLDPEDLNRILSEAATLPGATREKTGTVVELPVLYEGEFAPDLEEVARFENKTPEEIIRIHSGSDYYVYMLGFAPGHPYAARFENPFSILRRSSPRVRVPAGSIGIQRDMSDIIPFEMPTGWNIIGITPVLACDYRKDPPFLLKAGDWIRHVPIDRSQFREIRRQAELGEYVCRRRERGAAG